MSIEPQGRVQGPERDTAIDRPIFVIGTGRSGTTLFFRLLGSHPELAWFSNYANKFPAHPWLEVAARALDLPFTDRVLDPYWRITPKPTEAYEVLRGVTDGIFIAPRPLVHTDLTPDVRERFRRRVLLTLRLQGKQRFAHKHTGFPRTPFLSAVFPTARFIHVYRDGRSVANSLTKVDWWHGMESWRWGPMRPEYAAEYRRSGEDRTLLAAITWKTLMDEICEKTRGMPADRLLSIRYDELIADVRGVLERVLAFCELGSPERFWRRVARHDISDRDQKWKSELGREQRELVEQSLAAHLAKYGFER